MNIEFTQEDFTKLDELIQVTPFKYAYPLFIFFQNKVSKAQSVKEISEGKAQLDINGN